MPDDHRPDGLTRSSVHAWEDSSSEAVSAIAAGRGVRAGVAPDEHHVLDPESAARGYLDDAVASSSLPSLSAEVDTPETQLAALGTETLALTGTRTVKFRQTYHGIPVYGSFVVVELDGDNELVGIDTTTGRPEGVDPVATIAPARAVEIARGAPGGYTPVADVIVPRQHFYFDGKDERWRLVYGRGGPMTSSINCVVQSAARGPKDWGNAFWNGTQMVYGQLRHGDDLRSLSANVDVVGHEIFHGVTDSTSRLEYRAQSGALNESYSDVFGTIIANRGNEDPRTWDWLIGEKLFPDREALRDMADPTRFDQPAHMDDYQDLPVTRQGDWGGVHTNSGIPNKAAYVLLTTEDEDGALTLTPSEVSAVYYIALTQRLSRTSQFADARRASVASARSFFRSRPPEERERKVSAVGAAFDAVGIV